MKFQLEFIDKLNCFKSPSFDLFFSGEIYNLSELSKKHELVESDDLKQLALLFEKLGRSLFEQLNGIYILFIHEKKLDELLVVRDHIGLYPLYYLEKDGTYYFSDYDLNLTRLLSLPFEKLNIHYFLTNLTICDYHLTIHPSIKSMKFGSYLQINLKNGIIKLIEYWNPLNTNKLKLSATELISSAHENIDKAISIRIHPNQKHAFHISGGIDCSTIAAIVTKKNPQSKSYGFSWSPNPSLIFKNLEFDERKLVQKTCQHLLLEPYFAESKKSNQQTIDPRFNFFAELAILEKAKQNNIQLIYSGYGGDEFISAPFFGIKIFQFKRLKLAQLFSKKKSLRKNLGSFLREVYYPLIGKIPKKIIQNQRQYLSYLKHEYQVLNTDLLKKDYCYTSRCGYHLNLLERGHLAHNVRTLQFLGKKFDVNYSFPFLDKNLINFVFQLDDRELSNLSENRPLVRLLATKLLPAEVSARVRKTDPAINEQHKYENRIFVEDFVNTYNFQEANYLKNFFNFDMLEAEKNHFKNKTFDNETQEQVFITTILCLSYIEEFRKYYEVYSK